MSVRKRRRCIGKSKFLKEKEKQGELRQVFVGGRTMHGYKDSAMMGNRQNS
jgi:hypothetical protein